MIIINNLRGMHRLFMNIGDVENAIKLQETEGRVREHYPKTVANMLERISDYDLQEARRIWVEKYCPK